MHEDQSAPMGRGDGSSRALAQNSLRRHNLSVVLRRLRDHGPASRAQLATATSMTKAGVSKIVDDLLERGLVVELTPSGIQRRGRPSIPLGVNASAQAAIGLELNVFHSAVVVTDLLGNVVYRERQPFHGRMDPVTTVRSISEMVGRAISAGRDACDRVAGMMVAIPGFVDPHQGLVKDAPTLGWTDVELRTLLADIVPEDVPLRFDSMSNLASLAETRALGPTVPYSLLHIEFGVVVGSALVLRGRGERGASGALGALGHVGVDPAGPACHCGQRGCVETFVGLQALLQRSAPDLMSSWGEDPASLVEEITRRAEAEDRRVLEGLRTTAKQMSRTVAMAVSILDPEVVMLGGYTTVLAPWLMPTLLEHVTTDVPGARALRFRVQVSPLGADAGLAGATQVIRDQTFDLPADASATG